MSRVIRRRVSGKWSAEQYECKTKQKSQYGAKINFRAATWATARLVVCLSPYIIPYMAPFVNRQNTQNFSEHAFCFCAKCREQYLCKLHKRKSLKTLSDFNYIVFTVILFNQSLNLFTFFLTITEYS